MATTFELPPVGSRASVPPVSSVCQYLHGAEGVVEEHRYSHMEGQEVAVLKFDTPVPVSGSPMPLKTIGLRADQIKS